MRWPDLLRLVAGRTLFEAAALLAGDDSPAEVRRQLSRWTATGKLIQLRRGLYAVAPPFSHAAPDPFLLASLLRKPSYVSLQSALQYHGVIPESVPSVTSVTTGRPGTFRTAFGTFHYRHILPGLFWGYQDVERSDGDRACVAFTEKALLDLYHLTPGPVRSPFIRELRLAPEHVDSRRLEELAVRTARPRLVRAAALTARVLEGEKRGMMTL
jgi:hypothetical protein